MDFKREKISRTVFGTVVVLDTAKVFKLSLTMDRMARENYFDIWGEAEKGARAGMKNFDPTDIFFSEEFFYETDGLWKQDRYYTPRENRRRYE